MNHRIFERTLRPLVFQGACLFERHFLLKHSVEQNLSLGNPNGRLIGCCHRPRFCAIHQDGNNERLVEFDFGSSREDFTFQLPTQSIVAPVGKSDSALDFEADIVGVVDAGSQVYEIIYDFEVMTVNSDVGFC
nr:hypothetical protein [Vibrio anguillarum]